MPLQNEQAEFAETLFSDATHPNTLHPPENMLIYRNTIQATLVKTLQGIYPMIHQLVGDAFFRVLAKAYLQHYPSRSGNLHDYGEYLSDFLAHHPKLADFPYLAEVAEVEWVCHHLFFAADHAPLDVKRLETITEDQYDSLHFSLHPASLVVQCQYPILRILALCNGKADADIQLEEGGVNLLIIRPESDVLLIPLNEADFTFLSALQENETLGNAIAAALQIDPQFDLEAKLPIWVREKIIVDFYAAHE